MSQRLRPRTDRSDGPPVRSRDGWTRRQVLAASVGAGAATALSGTALAQDEPDYDGWFDDVDNYDGTTVDATGQSDVTVEVGADGNGGTFAYAPPAVRVEPGTTVTFEWVSDTHNVVVEDQPDDADWAGHDPIENEGFTYEHTFETPGVYTYFCEPHLAAGMKGAVVVDEDAGAGGPVVEAEYGEWFDDVDNYDGTTVDATGQSDATVEVGADGNGGTFAYAPPAVRVEPGTTVTFEWVSDTHNVVVEDQPDDADWAGHDPIENEGFTYEHTFETPGVYTYFCEPHLAAGMKGAVVVDEDAGAGGPVVEAEYGEWFDDVDNYDGTTVDATGQSDATVEVGADGNGGTFAYAPPAVRVAPGTTVTFEWVSDTHNVVVEDQPDDADWAGHDPIENEGFTYEHTFETPGVYTYFCEPHLAAGMKGAVVVGRAPGAGGGGGPSGVATLPVLEQWIAAAGIGLGLLSPLLFAVASRTLESWRTAPVPSEEAPVAEPERAIDHDAFEPGGTWTLVLVYLAILLFMWVFVYFVEFLGRGPTVIG